MPKLEYLSGKTTAERIIGNLGGIRQTGRNAGATLESIMRKAITTLLAVFVSLLALLFVLVVALLLLERTSGSRLIAILTGTTVVVVILAVTDFLLLGLAVAYQSANSGGSAEADQEFDESMLGE